MKVELVAHTQLTWQAEELIERQRYTDDADHLAVLAGRTCYLSYNRPNPNTREDLDYLARTIGQEQHESIAEHASASFYVAGVSRNMLLELERHRFLSFSVVSTRYVDASTLGMVHPPALEGGLSALDPLLVQTYRDRVEQMMWAGFTRKQAREAAVAYLPSNLETRFVVSGNMRAWRDVIKKRHHTAANAEIQEFAKLVLLTLRDIAPGTFQDIPSEPYGSE